MFSSNLKWIENQSPNIIYLACCEIKKKKFVENNL